MIPIATIFDGTLWVHYGQASVQREDGAAGADLRSNFAGQRNGLLGAANAGELVLLTGLHTGQVGLRVDVDAVEPPVEDGWEEIVEVSFTPAAGSALHDWNGELVVDLFQLAGPQRVRFHAKNMDAGGAQDTSPDDETVIDSYALVFWPAPPAPDRILKQTSEIAAYWHTAWK